MIHREAHLKPLRSPGRTRRQEADHASSTMRSGRRQSHAGSSRGGADAFPGVGAMRSVDFGRPSGEHGYLFVFDLSVEFLARGDDGLVGSGHG